MAKYAPVCPIRILKRLPNEGGNYHLILAHDVLNHPVEFTDFFGGYRHQYDTIILDNSVTELGTAVNTDVIEKAAQISHANVIVLPDVYNDCDQTIEQCTKALKEWPQYLLSKNVMYVPQGNTWEEFVRSAEALAKHPGISWWGVPRNLVEKLEFGTRRRAALMLYMLNPTRKIHLLGFNNADDIFDDMYCARLPFIEGIDSAVPIRAATLGLEMSFNLKLPPRGDWWDTVQHVPLMDRNFNTTRRWAADVS